MRTPPECPRCDSRESLQPTWVPRYYRYKAICDCCSQTTWMDRDMVIVPTPVASVLDASGNMMPDP